MRTRILWLVVSLDLAGAAVGAAGPESHNVHDLLPELSRQTPRLRFHFGQAVGNTPAISGLLPDLPFTPSPWYVAQWQQTSYVRPAPIAFNDNALRDPYLGTPRYAYNSPDGHAQVAIFRQARGWLYELSERGGVLTAVGGSNLFLAADVDSMASSLDQPVTVELTARLSAAHINYDTQSAKATSGVFGQAFSGYGLMFYDPETSARQFVFMQIPLSVTGVYGGEEAHICSLVGNTPSLLYLPRVDHSRPLLPFESDPGILHKMRYRIDELVKTMVSHPFSCQGSHVEWSKQQQDTSNWRLTCFYVGLELNDRDMRETAVTHDQQGSVSARLQIGDVRITRGTRDR
jgi:hypothetical protein